MTDKQPQTLSKQTVLIPASHLSQTIKILEEGGVIKRLESVYVLTEQEMDKVKREAAEKAYDACLESIHNNPTDDVEVSKQNYINTNYPL